MYITWRLGSTWMFDPWNNFVVKSLLFSIRFYSYIFSRDVWSVSLCLCCCRIFLAIYQSFSKHFFRLSFCCNRAMKNSVFFLCLWVDELLNNDPAEVRARLRLGLLFVQRNIKNYWIKECCSSTFWCSACQSMAIKNF